jgi:predicted ATPase
VELYRGAFLEDLSLPDSAAFEEWLLLTRERFGRQAMDALQLRLAGGQQQLLDFLRRKQLLLIVDNLEHLLDGVGLLAEILHTAPGVKMLATSRERLQLHGERAFPPGRGVLPEPSSR